MESMQNTQKGSVLAVSLVLLTAITLIAISSMQRSGLQTKIVSNLQHHEILFQTTLN
jgi:type IV pilus assembly protein PilX